MKRSAIILATLLIVCTLNVCLTSADPKVEEPTFSPQGGTYTSPQYVRISCSTANAIIRYTTNGSVPLPTSKMYEVPISVASNTTIKAIAFLANSASPLAIATYIINLQKVATPTFSPEAGTYSSPQNIIIECATDDAIIHYTLDGSTPSSSSPVYYNPIPISSTTTIKAKASKTGTTDSDIVTATYTINLPKVATPTINPASGIYTSPQNVTMQCATASAVIRYTTNGAEPTSTSTVYTGTISVTSTTTVKAKAFKTSMTNSDTATATYTITLPPKVATPTFNPSGGTYSSVQNVILTCSTSSASIRYTTDGSEPTDSSTLYANPIQLSSTTTIRAKAFKTDMRESNTASATYTINLPKVATPTFNPPSGTYSGVQSVAIQCATSGVTIRYTDNGADPTSTSTVYTGPISLNASTTLKAKAFKTGMTDSNTVTATYTINLPKVATPTFNPTGGTYTSPKNVAIQCATSGATIRYTTNGAEPTSTSTVYSSPISIDATATIKAKAFKANMTESSQANATYTINLPSKVATPTFNPSGGTYSSAQNIEVSCSTSGATIRYTIDSSEPSSSSAVYSSPISIESTTTVKAKAFKSEMTESDTAEEEYTIAAEPQPNKVSTPTFSPEEGTYSSTQNIMLTCATPGATIRYTIDGSEPYSSSSAVYSGPFQVITSTTVKARAFLAGMTDSDTASATYTIGTEKVANPTFTPAGGSYTYAQLVIIKCTTPGAVIRYTTSGLHPESHSPVYSGPISVNSSTTIMARAFLPGMEDSDIAYATFTIDPDTNSDEPALEPELAIGIVAIAVIVILALLGEAAFFLRRRIRKKSKQATDLTFTPA